MKFTLPGEEPDHRGDQPTVPDPEARMLDLFSGTGSVGRVFQSEGYAVTSLDCDPKVQADIQVDILEWDYKSAFQPGDFAVIFCCPPCTEYSTALTSRPRCLEEADRLVKRALEIVRYLKPQWWFMENPRRGYLAKQPFMHGIPYVDVDYCQFTDWGYQKPTRIWGGPHVLEVGPRSMSRPSLSQSGAPAQWSVGTQANSGRQPYECQPSEPSTEFQPGSSDTSVAGTKTWTAKYHGASSPNPAAQS